jgi:hypothetical protein
MVDFTLDVRISFLSVILFYHFFYISLTLLTRWSPDIEVHGPVIDVRIPAKTADGSLANDTHLECPRLLSPQSSVSSLVSIKSWDRGG